MAVKLNRCFTGLACLLGIIFASTLAARAQSDGEPEPIVSRALAATVDYGSDNIFQPSKQQTDFNLLGLDPGQIINITVWFTTKLAGQSILAEPLDGGTIFVPARGLVVGSDGTVVFQFQAGQGPGSCRLAVHQPDDQNLLNFWIVDLKHPENTPPQLSGGY
jgi:hypothetical protein